MAAHIQGLAADNDSSLKEKMASRRELADQANLLPLAEAGLCAGASWRVMPARGQIAVPLRCGLTLVNR